MTLCGDLGHVEREPAAVSDLQMINKQLEKLQVSDDESVFSESPGCTAAESCFGAKSRDFAVAEEQPVGQRQLSAYRGTRSHSPAGSLNNSGPSPSAKHRPRVSRPANTKTRLRTVATGTQAGVTVVICSSTSAMVDMTCIRLGDRSNGALPLHALLHILPPITLN